MTADKGKGKGAGFKSWSQAGSHDFTILDKPILALYTNINIILTNDK